jgi:hypothetical protein
VRPTDNDHQPVERDPVDLEDRLVDRAFDEAEIGLARGDGERALGTKLGAAFGAGRI